MFLSSSNHAISVDIMVWNGKNHVFLKKKKKGILSLHYFWKYLKAQVLGDRMQTTDELKDFICHETFTIPKAMTLGVWQNWGAGKTS